MALVYTEKHYLSITMLEDVLYWMNMEQSKHHEQYHVSFEIAKYALRQEIKRKKQEQEGKKDVKIIHSGKG